MPARPFLPVFLALALGCCVWSGACRKAPPDSPPPVEDVPTPEMTVAAFSEPEPPATPPAPVFVPDKSPQVSILLYHEFSTNGRGSDMVMPTARFREQMQMIKDSAIPVVSMADFLAWRRGEKNIPDPSILITMDDGWRSVYTDAFPILKEFGYPFTIFLYTNYVATGSRSLAVDQIKEMLAAGATLGCHSRGHPYPARMKAELAKGGDAAISFLREEMVASAEKLESLVGVRPKVYAYPGGFYTPEMFPVLAEAGYEAAFTVNPAKVTWQTPLQEVHRHVVHGNVASTFAAATTFRGVPLGRKLMGPDGKEVKLAVTPADGATIDDRQPEVTADLSPIPDLDPASLSMRVAGLGKVVPAFDPATRLLRYRLPYRLRARECSVFVSWKRLGAPDNDAPLVWKFRFDPKASLIKEVPPTPAGALRPPPVTRAVEMDGDQRAGESTEQSAPRRS